MKCLSCHCRLSLETFFREICPSCKEPLNASRRDFLTQMGTVGLSTTLFPLASRDGATRPRDADFSSGKKERLLNDSPPDPRWGLLANEGFDGARMKTTYFFAGNANDGSTFYELPVPPNVDKYTIHPSDQRNLQWSSAPEKSAPENRTFVINQMLDVGLNVITMSSWGPRGTDYWAHWAPMQTSTYAHDELFEAVTGKPLLIFPAIEVFKATPTAPEYEFAKHFPAVDPLLVKHIVDLVTRYLINPRDKNGQSHPEWKDHWAQFYNRDGKKLYALNLLHVSANLSNVKAGDSSFAAGFNAIAQAVKDQTGGIDVGFTLDVKVSWSSKTNMFQNQDSSFFFATPDGTGPWLRQTSAFLGIQSYIPEIWLDKLSSDQDRLNMKHTFYQQWLAQEVPVFMDVASGYDGHLVFKDSDPPPPPYGNNPSWRGALSLMQDARMKGLAFNPWNGYTEGYAAVSTLEYGAVNLSWLEFLAKGWFRVHGEFQASPKATVTALWANQQHLDLFVTDNQGVVWSSWWEARRDWQPWFSLHPEFHAAAGATVTALWANQQHLDLFVTDGNGVIWASWWEAKRGWQSWFSLHPEFHAAPGATVTALWANQQHLDLFVTNSQGVVWASWWEAKRGWQPWFSLHPEFHAAPGATVTALWANQQHLDLFVTDGNGVVWASWWEEKRGWQPWFSLHPEFHAAAGATVTALWANQQHLDLFVTDRNGVVWSSWWEEKPGWQPWFSLHPEFHAAAGATVTALWANQQHLDLFVTDGNGVVWSTWWEAKSGWQPWFSLHPDVRFTSGAHVTARWSNQRHLDLFVTDAAGKTWSTWWEAQPGWGKR